jgi:hypothetical protein
LFYFHIYCVCLALCRCIACIWFLSATACHSRQTSWCRILKRKGPSFSLLCDHSSSSIRNQILMALDRQKKSLRIPPAGRPVPLKVASKPLPEKTSRSVSLSRCLSVPCWGKVHVLCTSVLDDLTAVENLRVRPRLTTLGIGLRVSGVWL